MTPLKTDEELRNGESVSLPLWYKQGSSPATGTLKRMLLERHAQELLRRIDGMLSKIETRMARLSSPAELKKLEQDQVSLRLRASRIVQALESGSPDAFHHLHEEHGHDDDGHCHIQALHVLAGDEKQAAYQFDTHNQQPYADVVHGADGRVQIANSSVSLGGLMETTYAMLAHILPDAVIAL